MCECAVDCTNYRSVGNCLMICASHNTIDTTPRRELGARSADVDGMSGARFCCLFLLHLPYWEREKMVLWSGVVVMIGWGMRMIVYVAVLNATLLPAMISSNHGITRWRCGAWFCAWEMDRFTISAPILCACGVLPFPVHFHAEPVPV